MVTRGDGGRWMWWWERLEKFPYIVVDQIEEKGGGRH